MNKFRVFVAVCCLAAGMLVFGQNTVQEAQMVGNSDVVVVGTVTEVKDAPATGWKNGEQGNDISFRGVQGAMKVITFTVEEVLKGQVKATSISVGIAVAPNQKTDWLPRVGESKIFSMQRTRDGYGLSYGQQGIQALEKIDPVEQLIKSTPITLTMQPLAAPLYFSKVTPITMTVENISDAPLTLRNFSLGGFFHARRMENYVSFAVSLSATPAVAGEIVRPQPLVLEGKTKKEITLYVSPRVPQSMALLGPDSYMMTIAAIYGNVSYSTGEEKAPTLNCRSSWQDAYLGYPMVMEEPETEVVEKMER